MQNKIETVHFALTRTVVRMREEIHEIEKLDISPEIKQALINRAYDQIEQLERTRSEIMNILWA
jgi:hypothetical protein